MRMVHVDAPTNPLTCCRMWGPWGPDLEGFLSVLGSPFPLCFLSARRWMGFLCPHPPSTPLLLGTANHASMKLPTQEPKQISPPSNCSCQVFCSKWQKIETQTTWCEGHEGPVKIWAFIPSRTGSHGAVLRSGNTWSGFFQPHGSGLIIRGSSKTQASSKKVIAKIQGEDGDGWDCISKSCWKLWSMGWFWVHFGNGGIKGSGNRLDLCWIQVPSKS